MKNLTKRELEILQLTRDGLSNRSIATTLGISKQTVKNHLTPIFRKLNSTSRTHAVVIALRSGYLTLWKDQQMLVNAVAITAIVAMVTIAIVGIHKTGSKKLKQQDS